MKACFSGGCASGLVKKRTHTETVCSVNGCNYACEMQS